MAAPDLTTLADVKNWLGLPTSIGPDDAAILALVTSVSVWVQNWIGRQIGAATYTETLHGNGKGRIIFSNYPVISVTSLMIGTRAQVVRSQIGAAGYYFGDDSLYLDGGLVFDKGLGNVTVVYVAGYASVPQDLAQATKQLVALRYREKNRIGELSKSIQGETVTFDAKELPNDVKSVLSSYKRIWIAA